MAKPNEHAAQLKDPAAFDPKSFYRRSGGMLFESVRVPATVVVVWARLRGAPRESPAHPQALRFPRKDWTLTEAQKWLGDNDVSFTDFEPAALQLSGEAGYLSREGPIEFTANNGGFIEHVMVTAAGGEGGPPTFRMIAYTGEPMTVNGWDLPVVVELDGIDLARQELPVRLLHDRHEGVGHTTRVMLRAGELIAEGVISRATDAAREVVESAQKGFPWRVSISGYVGISHYVGDGESVVVNARKHDGPLYVANVLRLEELSFVDSGADNRTRATVTAESERANTMAKQDDKKKIDNGAPKKDLEAAPVDKPGDNPTDKPVFEPPAKPAKFPDQVPVAAPGEGPSESAGVLQLRAEMAAEEGRLVAVREICKGHDDLGIKAAADGWSKERAELEVLRAARPSAPAGHVSRTGVTQQILQAACMLGTGAPDLADDFDEQTLEAAATRYPHGLGLQELLLEAALANGYTGRTARDTRAILQHAFPPQGRQLEAAFSSIDISGILSAIANKFLLVGFNSVEQTWRRICSIRPVSDFKTVTSYRLTGVDQYEKVAPGGEIKHGTLAADTYTNKADTYALMLSIDRQDIINDDLGAISTVPRKLGRGSGLKINDVFWTEFMDNGSFFTGARGNYQEGAAGLSVLGIAGLTAAEILFYNQTDPDGKPIGTMPRILLVPPSLVAVGSALFKSAELRDTTASTKYPTANPHAGKFSVEVARYLSNSTYTGNSALAWYLLGDPQDLAVIEVALLNGQESPTVETAEANFGVLGIQMRGYHDFGVAKQEYRGGMKSKGEA